MSRSRRAACCGTRSGPSRRASTAGCRPITSRRGASARASPGSRGRSSARRSPPRSSPFGVVNAPGQRYHPAIIAQAAASLTEMFPERLWIALGSGEASNEHITGGRLAAQGTSATRGCASASDIMRALFAGEEVSHDGHVTVDRAKLWTLPQTPPPLLCRRGERGDRALGQRVGGRVRDRQPADRHAQAPARRVRTTAARSCRCT